MKKFKCTICGYIYDEEKGIPEKGIAAGTLFSDLPDDWKCPWCGAPKSMFKEEIEEKVDDATVPVEEIIVNSEIEEQEELREVSVLELGAICSNLAKGCEKQYLDQESKLFSELASYFKGKVLIDESKSYDDLLAKVNENLQTGFPNLKKMCADNNDRASLRATTWGEKTTYILKSLLERYKEEGSSFLENTNVYVCDICGFIYIGNDVPEVCPICKVPSLKILPVRGV